MNRRRTTRPSPRPFLKWAGGKRSLLPEILERLPDGTIETYVEPFLGGGAVFFELAKQDRFRHAVLADRNPELINAYLQVRDNVEAVIAQLERWGIPDRERYYEIRSAKCKYWSRVRRAARMLWLNRTGFNGLYRVNRKGEFNVPFGAHNLRYIVDDENLRRCSEALQGDAEKGITVEILKPCCFNEVLGAVGKGGVVYCDPPYWPASKTANFTSYDKLPFGPDEQDLLNAAFRALPDQGAVGLLSNSKTVETDALYAGLKCDVVQVRRSINRDGAGRGRVPELLVSVG